MFELGFARSCTVQAAIREFPLASCSQSYLPQVRAAVGCTAVCHALVPHHNTAGTHGHALRLLVQRVLAIYGYETLHDSTAIAKVEWESAKQ